MKIVILGANSYIARNLIQVLHESPERYELALYDREDSHKEGYDFYRKLDILDKEAVEKVSFDCDILYMFVGRTGSVQGFEEYDNFIDVNERALLNVLNACRIQNSKAKIIFPSTRLVYKGMPGKLKEDAQKEFKTIYAANKFSCEQYLKMYENVYGLSYRIFRICIPYGTMIPGAKSYGTAEFFLSKAEQGEDITLYGDGSQRRTLTYMGDLCDALIQGAESEQLENDVYNIGGEDYSLDEMAKLIGKYYHVGVSYVEWPETALKIESGDTVFDSEKLDSKAGITYPMKFEKWVQAAEKTFSLEKGSR